MNQNLRSKKSAELEAQLQNECRQCKERLKAKDQEMNVALKKQSSLVRELRRQVQQEKKRADQAEKQLEEFLGSGRHYRISGVPPIASDHSRNDGRSGVEGSSSVCSWTFGIENDRRSTHTFDGDESSCSASVLESDNIELISKLAQLQKKHSEIVDKLNVLEEENSVLRKEVAEKSEVIAEWIRTRPCGDSTTLPSSSSGIRIRRVLDMVRIDDSAADIRDMNRKLQRMLEETLSKNLSLQKLIF
uniref:Uncharacterized protein n=1 Tax=Syphacia muris TaxID=451379 RepID=A0A0N5ARU8_9BILA